jgi:uncharacterized protein YndB with AHSA1/START domain
MSDHSSSVFTCSIEIHASQERVWEVLLTPNKWGQAFGEGTVVDVVWQEGASIIWRDSENNIGANGRVEIIKPPVLLELRYYDSATPAADAPLGNYYERLTIKSSGDKLSLLEVEVGELNDEDIAFHQKLWLQAFDHIKALAE